MNRFHNAQVLWSHDIHEYSKIATKPDVVYQANPRIEQLLTTIIDGNTKELFVCSGLT